MQEGLAHDWAIIGAGVRAYDSDMRSRLMQQDYLTTLIELDPKGTSAEVVGSMIGYVAVEDGNGPLIDQMAADEIRIVSLTVTEGGYYLDPVTKAIPISFTMRPIPTFREQPLARSLPRYGIDGTATPGHLRCRAVITCKATVMSFGKRLSGWHVRVIPSQMTRARREARQIIRDCCKATQEHAVIFTGSGATQGINRIVHLMGRVDMIDLTRQYPHGSHRAACVCHGYLWRDGAEVRRRA